MRTDEYNTAKMMKDLERQVTQLRDGRAGNDTPSLISTNSESMTTNISESGQSQPTDTRFSWGDDGWSMETW